MSFDWTEFLRLAEALQSDPESPGPRAAALRSAASRAYYAAFHCALGFASGEEFVPSRLKDDHRSLPDYFRKYRPSDPVREQIATNLDRLRDRRREADYDDVLRRTPETQAYLAVATANRVIEDLKSLRPSAKPPFY